jgi:hypothetical protein
MSSQTARPHSQLWLPNKRLKLAGPAFKGSGRLCTSQSGTAEGSACAGQRSPRSLTAIRLTAASD